MFYRGASNGTSLASIFTQPTPYECDHARGPVDLPTPHTTVCCRVKLDSADAYTQPALLYRVSSAGMAKDHPLDHSTYDHFTSYPTPIFYIPTFGTFFYLRARLYDPHSYKLLQATLHLIYVSGGLPALHKHLFYSSDCEPRGLYDQVTKSR
eukprot:COSAG01_NODE_32_length_35644_cov_22.273738_26_plen_152_part_00